MHRSSNYRRQTFEQLDLHHELTCGRFFAPANFHRLLEQMFIVWVPIGTTIQEMQRASFFKCPISKINVHCRNFRDESVSMSKPSKMQKAIQNVPQEDRSFGWHCSHFWIQSTSTHALRSQKEPPTVTIMFLVFYTDIESSRVDRSELGKIVFTRLGGRKFPEDASILNKSDYLLFCSQ